jgi:uncharacterized protein YecA (UPF0149 family)
VNEGPLPAHTEAEFRQWYAALPLSARSFHAAWQAAKVMENFKDRSLADWSETDRRVAAFNARMAERKKP